MTDTELHAITKVTADTLGKAVGEDSTIIVIVYRPFKPFAAHVSKGSPSGVSGLVKTIHQIGANLSEGLYDLRVNLGER